MNEMQIEQLRAYGSFAELSFEDILFEKVRSIASFSGKLKNDSEEYICYRVLLTDKLAKDVITIIFVIPKIEDKKYNFENIEKLGQGNDAKTYFVNSQEIVLHHGVQVILDQKKFLSTAKASLAIKTLKASVRNIPDSDIIVFSVNAEILVGKKTEKLFGEIVVTNQTSQNLLRR